MAEQSFQLLFHAVQTQHFFLMEYLFSEYFHTTSYFGPSHIYNHSYK